MQDKVKLTVFDALDIGDRFAVFYWHRGESVAVKAIKRGDSFAKTESGDYIAMISGDMVVRLV